jgi:hypothetical protein
VVIGGKVGRGSMSFLMESFVLRILMLRMEQ